MKRVLLNARLLGIVFLAMLVGGVYLTYAIFTKQFSDYEEVQLETSSIGNGSEPNLRTVTRSLASCGGKPPGWVIWVTPLTGIGSLICGAEMIVPSSVMAKYSPR